MTGPRHYGCFVGSLDSFLSVFFWGGETVDFPLDPQKEVTLFAEGSSATKPVSRSHVHHRPKSFHL